MKLVIASNNFHKIEEIKDILGSHFESIQSMREAHIELDVDENADSFMGNARLKAAACARLLPGYAVLADDSGLCVDALNGEPGVCSARYAGSGHNDAENRQKLLHNLRNVPLDKRDAHFACAMVLILPARRSTPTAPLTDAYSSAKRAKTASATIRCSSTSLQERPLRR